ncbi:hypothetical protein G9A89_012216 [Geosiphon pyriformis]|nr:hypothetical protein G9A89_012216 [Geosiphon pyriformis]
MYSQEDFPIVNGNHSFYGKDNNRTIISGLLFAGIMRVLIIVDIWYSTVALGALKTGDYFFSILREEINRYTNENNGSMEFFGNKFVNKTLLEQINWEQSSNLSFFRKRNALCQYKLEHPNYSANRLIKIFNLKNVFDNSGQLTKDKKKMFPKINNVLKEWMLGTLTTNCILTGKILQTKALKFAEKFPKENNFKASDSWLEKFKKCHNLHHIKMYGKANSAPLEILPKEQETA